MSDVSHSGVFPYPAGILLFNRPAYAEQTLAALAAQVLPFDSSRLTIVRDGYAGSRDERYGNPDLTHDVDALVERYFPDATYVRFDRNRGIALAYEELANAAFAHDTQWAAFFEEDFVVDPDYTKVLAQLTVAAKDSPQVAVLSATGDVAVKRTRGMQTLYPDRHLWAYVMRRTMWAESREVIDAYLGFLGNGPYWDRNNDAIVSAMAELGFMVPGGSQDYIKLGFMRANGYLALNTAQAHGYYIGREGLHHTEQLFAAWGYDAERHPRAEKPDIPKFTPTLLAELEQVSRQMWARESLGYRQTVGERISVIQQNLTDVRGQLRVVREAFDETNRELQRTSPSAANNFSWTGEDRGGWTWFGGTSALSIGGVHLLGMVRRQHLTVMGESVLAVIDNEGSVVRTIPLLRRLKLDDHNVPTVVALDAKRFIVAVTGHGGTNSVRLAVGVARNGNVRLGPRVDIEFDAPTTYAHVIPESEDSFLLITRCDMKNMWARRIALPTLETMSDPMRVFPWAPRDDDPWFSRRDGQRPYLITRESGEEVLFGLTHDHPRGYRNGIVAGKFRGAQIFDLDDNLVHTIEPDAPLWDPFTALTAIVEPGGQDIPWIADIAPLTRDGAEVGVAVAYSVASMPEREFRYGLGGWHPALRYEVVRRLTGATPERIFEADAGPSLFAGEEHYAGGIALNPKNPDDIVYSVGVVPETDDGSVKPAVWSLMSREFTNGREQRRLLARGNAGDSIIRPLFSASAPRSTGHALFAMRGRYSSYRDFATRIHATVFRAGESCIQGDDAHLDLAYPVRSEGAMPHAETAFLQRRLRKSRHFIEFGAGGSTLLAFDRGVPRVVSVESDRRLAAYLTTVSTRYTTRYDAVTPEFTDIGPWGFPLAEGDHSSFGRAYANAVESFVGCDTVLIDGRFRVACALTVAAHVTGRTVLLVDDYGDRDHYRVLERFLGRPRMKGRIAQFVLARPVSVPSDVMNEAYGDAR